MRRVPNPERKTQTTTRETSTEHAKHRTRKTWKGAVLTAPSETDKGRALAPEGAFLIAPRLQKPGKVLETKRLAQPSNYLGELQAAADVRDKAGNR